MKLPKPCLLLAVIALLMISNTLYAQKKSKIEKLPFCGVRIDKKEFLNEVYKQQFDFMDLKENDTIVDIGAGSGWYEGALSATMPFSNLHFFLVDISTDCLNEKKVSNMKEHYSSLKGSPITNTFTLINNSVDSLYLPARTFKKVWILNTLHEVPDQQKIIRDMYNILQPGGEVIILEIIPRKPHELHGGCHKPLLSKQEWDDLFTANHFSVKNTMELADKDNKRSPFQIIRYIRN
jgi:ubiquinone/menaquinone biosynthesis C-methylase UbiE